MPTLQPSAGQRCFLDPRVDLAINFLKLSQLTGSGEWTRAARAVFEAIRRDFRLPAGYAWEVNPETGGVRDPLIEVKYLGLLLKGFLGLREVERGHSQIAVPNPRENVLLEGGRSRDGDATKSRLLDSCRAAWTC